MILNPPAKSPITFHSGNTIPAATTAYISPGSFNGGSIGLIDIPLPFACTISKLYLDAGVAPGASESFTYTLMKNAVATALTGTVEDSATTASDLTHSVEFAAGDKITLRLVTSSGATVTYHMASVQCLAH